MDPPLQQPAQQPQTTARDMVFCHECENEWYRDEHGLSCPECHSDFTEIIEENHDPRVAAMADSDDDGPPPLGAFHHHHPWDAPDPDEDDINQLHWSTGPNTFAVQGVIFRDNLSQRRADPHDHDLHNPVLGTFATMLQNLVGGLGQQPPSEQPPSEQPSGSPSPGQGPNDRFSGTLPGGNRFTYQRTVRLHGPDGTHRGAHLDPSGDELNGLVEHLLGAAMGGPPGHTHPPSGQPGQPPGQPGQFPGQPQINPLAAIFAQLMNPGMAAPGDFVYSQEALDRIISQLMEQNTSNAPGPATPEAIGSLPKKIITIEDLGPDGRAECSICMDEVTVGEEVAQLPCHHWFHQPCVAMWLGEHDTCPHCRKGIMDHDKAGESANSSTNTADASSGSNGAPATPSRQQMPGTFGAGTEENPFIVPETPEQSRLHAQQDQRSSSERQPSPHSVHSDGDASGGGLGDRIRRGLFGQPR
ncbi:uncharacterized protein BDZ99DRAFT_513643 [Mytilinidion resinicola]|uniref:RING-type E3 ubiquitin transferase n=1 Tax=Mytilinidion resinicola TaxID=574789 RepID=A0A6A6Z9M5_9PEZI|nr:uncharacterized protein BDZ99DRAFT_513643 [Mytilinidion resinicola]KAF2817399.1 hypothetical protein BDZ99DRAFT_513643 [Mytilinidion resinicola]